MKKLLIGAVAAGFFISGAVAQVLPVSGVQNTLWSGGGKPMSGGGKYYGFIDTLQARVDVGRFTVEGMLNWGALCLWDTDDDFDMFKFENTSFNALERHYYNEDCDSASGEPYNGVKSQTAQDSYYVNFLWHPFDNFDVGVGTKLDWKVGPAPTYGAHVWEADAHLRQGGFSTSFDDRSGNAYDKFRPDEPGTADVVGFIHYANAYAKKAIGVRYNYQGKFGIQAGAALANGADTDGPIMNLGVALQPVNWLLIATAYEGLFQQYGNFYAGVTLGAKSFILDAYFACDGINTKDDDDGNEIAVGTGAAVTFAFSKIGLTIRPEAGINFFEDSDWTPAWYAGGLVKFDINERMALQAWTSFAVGSKDREWADDNTKDDWIGGRIFNIRPEFTFNLNKNHALSAYVNIENRVSFDKESRTFWTTGVFWTYKLHTGKLTAAKKG